MLIFLKSIESARVTISTTVLDVAKVPNCWILENDIQKVSERQLAKKKATNVYFVVLNYKFFFLQPREHLLWTNISEDDQQDLRKIYWKNSYSYLYFAYIFPYGL